nr:hypothetical protein [Streptomyces sp. NTH33]
MRVDAGAVLDQALAQQQGAAGVRHQAGLVRIDGHRVHPRAAEVEGQGGVGEGEDEPAVSGIHVQEAADAPGVLESEIAQLGGDGVDRVAQAAVVIAGRGHHDEPADAVGDRLGGGVADLVTGERPAAADGQADEVHIEDFGGLRDGGVAQIRGQDPDLVPAGAQQVPGDAQGGEGGLTGAAGHLPVEGTAVVQVGKRRQSLLLQATGAALALTEAGVCADVVGVDRRPPAQHLNGEGVRGGHGEAEPDLFRIVPGRYLRPGRGQVPVDGVAA